MINNNDNTYNWDWKILL